MFKVGDRVRIKKSLRCGTNKYNVYVTPDMVNMAGQIQTITEVEPDGDFTAYKIITVNGGLQTKNFYVPQK